MSNPVADSYRGLLATLSREEADLTEKKVWARLRGTEEWDMLEAWLMAQIAARQQRFMSSDEMTIVQVERARAEMRLLRRLLTVGQVTAEELSSAEKRVEGLRKRIKDRQNAGLDRDFSDPQAMQGA